MRLAILGMGAVVCSGAVSAQTQNSTTNCYDYGYSVQCNTTTQANQGVHWDQLTQQQQQTNQQNQQNMNQAFENLGSAIARDRERKRQKRIEKEVAEAMARDTAPALPPPAEVPVLLTCHLQDQSQVSVALYEKHQRADVTTDGQTKSRAATFTPYAVTWQGAMSSNSIGRSTLEFRAIGTLPALKGATLTGMCTLADRKF